MRPFTFSSQRRLNPRLAGFVTAFFFFFSFVPASAIVSDRLVSTVDGSFQILSDAGPIRHIEFHVKRNFDGSVVGDTTFKDDPVVDTRKPNEDAADSSQPFFFKADFDCLVIYKNRAVMSGAITASSAERYVGRRVLVVAQDNGGSTDPSKTDRLTWGIYLSEQKQWLASDSERASDEVSQLSWTATDSERVDDEGIPSNKEQTIGCQSFPLSTFAFISAKQGHGSVRVRP